MLTLNTGVIPGVQNEQKIIRRNVVMLCTDMLATLSACL